MGFRRGRKVQGATRNRLEIGSKEREGIRGIYEKGVGCEQVEGSRL